MKFEDNSDRFQLLCMLDENRPFVAVFQKPQVSILQFIMVSGVDLWLQCIITIPEIPKLGGIWSYAAVFSKPEVAILNFIVIGL